MMRCIICDNEIDEENEEHIIPFALGNKKFTINSICKKCNSLLGQKIDNETTENIMAQLFRQQNDIPGHSGTVPNAFAKGKNEKGEDIRVSKDMKPTIVPRDYSDNKKIHIVAPSVEQAEAIIEKKLKRKGLPPLTEEQKRKIRETKPEKYQPEISYQFSLNLDKLKLEWIRIAFETLYYQHGEEILQEESICQLKKILYDYLYFDKYDKKLINGKIGTTKDKKELPELDALKQLLNEKVIHLIQVISKNNEITVLIIAEGMIDGAVKIPVSDSSKYNSKTYMILYPSGNIVDLYTKNLSATL